MKGFTLLELLIVIALTAIVGVSGIVISNRTLANQQLETITDMIAAEIHQAQADAYAQTDDLSHGVVVTNTEITRYAGDNFDGRDVSKDIMTTFDDDLEVSGVDEFRFEKGTIQPSAYGVLTVTRGSQMADIELSSYGILEITTGDVDS